MRSLNDYLKVTDLSQIAANRAEPFPLGFLRGERGDMIYLTCEETIQMLGVLELRPGIGRGRHAHKTKREHLYFINGLVKGCYWFEEHPQDRHEILHKPGQLVTVEPGLYHEFVAVEPSWAVEFSSAPYDQADTFYPKDPPSPIMAR